MTRGSVLRSVAAMNSAAFPAETDDIVLSSERMPVPPPGRWPAGRVALTLGLIAAIGGVLTVGYVAVTIGFVQLPAGRLLDRKSTRLNSSHVAISYAVFCLKKKTGHNGNRRVRW